MNLQIQIEELRAIPDHRLSATEYRLRFVLLELYDLVMSRENTSGMDLIVGLPPIKLKGKIED